MSDHIYHDSASWDICPGCIRERKEREHPYPRSFVLRRTEDETGVSGTGDVAWGVEFPDGVCITRWCVTEIRQTCVWNSIDDIKAIHGHNGKTELVWLADPSTEGVE